MKLEASGFCRVYRKDFEWGPAYSGTIGKKNQDGTWDNAYLNLKFKKGVELKDNTEIEIKNGFMTFYRNKDNEVKLQVLILDFERVGEPEIEERIPEGFQAMDDMPF